MPIMVEREKWILYKHTCDYELIKAVAMDVKNSCASNISSTEKYRMQERLAALDLYKMRNPKTKPLDSINHRINTLEFYMFGYEDNSEDKRFIFSPLGNLFLKYIGDEQKLKKIFTTMLFAIQFPHWANGTPDCFKLYPFRLLLKLMSDERLEYKLYSTEYAYIVAFEKNASEANYENLVRKILEFRNYNDDKVVALLKEDEHTYVNCIYEWQYYTQKLLKTIGIIDVYEGDNNIFPASFVVTLSDLSYSKDVEQKIWELDNVKKITSSDETIDTLIRIANGVKIAIGIIFVFLIIIAITIISNTIKLSVHARRKEISIMKYVGATNSFIRWPFIIEGIIIGIVSSGITLLLLGGIYDVVIEKIGSSSVLQTMQIQLLQFSDMLQIITIVFLVLGIGMGIIGSSISMRNYLEV